jgi:hypothetical protein
VKELEKLASLMRTHNVKTIEAQYEGSGDSGCINAIDFNTEHLIEAVVKDIENQAEEAAWEILATSHPGWEINDGGDGEIVFEKDEDGAVTAKLSHKEYFVDSTSYSHEFQVS